MGEQSLTYFAYVCFMPRNDGVFLPYCCAYHELCVRTGFRSVHTQGPVFFLQTAVRSGYTFFKMALAGAPSLPVSFTGKQINSYSPAATGARLSPSIIQMPAPSKA